MNTTNYDMVLQENLRKALYGDYGITDVFPEVRPLLAHYTSISALEKIMDENEIWFSNPLQMNDLEELRFGMIEGSKIFNSNSKLKSSLTNGNDYGTLVYHFTNLFNDFDRNHAFDTYVFCLSEHTPSDYDGALSMWRGYGAGGSGVSIVFDTKKLQENQSSPLTIGKVEYKTTDDRIKWMSGKMDQLADILQQTAANRPLTNEDLYLAAYYWIERLKEFSLFTKHKGFDEEREWRVVYRNERDQNPPLLKEMLGYAITNRGAEQKLKLKISPKEGIFGDNFTLENIIDRIILGPTASSVLSAHAAQRILERKNKKSLAAKVYASTIPFRS